MSHRSKRRDLRGSADPEQDGEEHSYARERRKDLRGPETPRGKHSDPQTASPAKGKKKKGQPAIKESDRLDEKKVSDIMKKLMAATQPAETTIPHERLDNKSKKGSQKDRSPTRAPPDGAKKTPNKDRNDSSPSGSLSQHWAKQVNDWIADPGARVFDFPPSFSADQRAFARAYADKRGVYSATVEESRRRHVVLYKDRPSCPENVVESTPEKARPAKAAADGGEILDEDEVLVRWKINIDTFLLSNKKALHTDILSRNVKERLRAIAEDLGLDITTTGKGRRLIFMKPKGTAHGSSPSPNDATEHIKRLIHIGSDDKDEPQSGVSRNKSDEVKRLLGGIGNSPTNRQLSPEPAQGADAAATNSLKRMLAVNNTQPVAAAQREQDSQPAKKEPVHVKEAPRPEARTIPEQKAPPKAEAKVEAKAEPKAEPVPVPGQSAPVAAKAAQLRPAAAPFTPPPPPTNVVVGTSARGGGGSGRGRGGNHSKDPGALSLWKRMIDDFLDDPTSTELVFPTTLTAADRQEVHRIATNFGLHHQSSGPKSARQLALTKGITNTREGFHEAQEFLCPALRSENVSQLSSMVDTVWSMAAKAHKKIGRMRVRQPRLSEASLRPPPRRPTGVSPKQVQEMASFRMKLPVAQARKHIVDEVRKNPVCIIVGETGSGKTTQIPQFMLDEPGIVNGQIICTQPRRISAITVSQRVAQERCQQVGDEVGYRIRFESEESRATRLFFVTTGILLRRLQSDPVLEGIGCVIVDEVHERDIQTDISLALLRDLVHKRKGDLKLIVMSATIQVERLAAYFETHGHRTPPLVHVSGSMFPVKQMFLEDAIRMVGISDARHLQELTSVSGESSGGGDHDSRRDNALEAVEMAEKVRPAVQMICDLIVHIHNRRLMDDKSSILVFLPGWTPITAIRRRLMDGPLARILFVVPVHSTLTSAEQQKAFSRPPVGMRKVVLATNIAETSITIDDVGLVIDTCMHKCTNFSVRGNIETLDNMLISRASAKQRRGRAGRVQKGECIHLLPRRTFEGLPEFGVPEMQRTPLDEICLMVKACTPAGESVESTLLKCLDPPPRENIQHFVQFLQELGAFDSNQNLTQLGRVLALLPLPPTAGKMLLFAAMFGVLTPIATIAALTTAKSAFSRVPREEVHEFMRVLETLDVGKKSDHLILLNAFNKWEKASDRRDFEYKHFLDRFVLQGAQRMRDQFKKLLSQSGFIPAKSDWPDRFSQNTDLVRFVIAYSNFPHIAALEEGKAKRDIALVTFDNKRVEVDTKESVNGGRRKPMLVLKQAGIGFLVYSERMQIGTNVKIKTTTAIAPAELIMSCQKLHINEFVPPPPYDAEAQYNALHAVLSSRTPTNSRTLNVESGFKRFACDKEAATLVIRIRDALNLFVAHAIHGVDATCMCDEMVDAVSYLISNNKASGMGAGMRHGHADGAHHFDSDTESEGGGEGPGVIEIFDDPTMINFLTSAMGDVSVGATEAPSAREKDGKQQEQSQPAPAPAPAHQASPAPAPPATAPTPAPTPAPTTPTPAKTPVPVPSQSEPPKPKGQEKTTTTPAAAPGSFLDYGVASAPKPRHTDPAPPSDGSSSSGDEGDTIVAHGSMF